VLSRILEICPELSERVFDSGRRLVAVRTGRLYDTEALALVSAIRRLEPQTQHLPSLRECCDRFVALYDQIVPSFFLVGVRN
jgi:hypothetical protein